MTCLEDIAGISGANSLRNKYELKKEIERDRFSYYFLGILNLIIII